jgi:uncharacterized protein (DUF1501 family)
MLDHVSTRRVFLQRGLTILAAAPTVPAFLDQTVLAMADPLDGALTQRPSGKDGKVLVVLQLAGGNDGLSMVVPYADDDYHKARPGLRHEPKNVLKLDDYAGLNPNLKPLADFFHDGRLAVVQGVGYPNPNRSHFRSTDIWQTAEPERVDVASGWVGRYFDNTCQGADPHFGVSIGRSLPLAMQGERYTPVSFERPETYQFTGPEPAIHRKLNGIDTHGAKATSASGELDFLRRTALDVQLSSDQILGATRKYKAKGNYPNDDFGHGLRTVAAMIGGGLSTRVYYVSLAGFDTHVVQRGKHDALMSQLAQGVAAFWADLKHQGNADRVLMMTFSEFGRRVAQNDSGGTDHGAAAPMLLIGPTVASGLLGKHPSLKPKDLDEGDLRYNTDFRSVYAAVLEQWLETPSAKILGKPCEPMKVFRA